MNAEIVLPLIGGLIAGIVLGVGGTAIAVWVMLEQIHITEDHEEN